MSTVAFTARWEPDDRADAARFENHVASLYPDVEVVRDRTEVEVRGLRIDQRRELGIAARGMYGAAETRRA